MAEPINESIEEPINNYPVTTETPHESSRWVEHVTFALAIACRPAGAPIILHQRADVECMSPHHLLFTTVVPLLLFCCSYDSLRRLVKKVLVQRPNPTDKLPLDVILGLLSASAKWILRRLPESVTYGAFIRCVYIVARKREALDKEVAPLTLPAQLAILRSAGYQRGCLALSLSPTADRDLNGDLNLPSYSFFKDLLFHLKWDSRINRYPSHCVVAAVEQNLTSVTSDPTRPVLVLSAYPAIGCRAHGPDSAPRGHLELRCDVATNQEFNPFNTRVLLVDGIPKDKALTFARAFSSSSPAFDKTRFVCHVCGLSRTGCRSIVAHLRSTHPRGAGPRLPVYEALARAGPPTRVAAEVITANS